MKYLIVISLFLTSCIKVRGTVDPIKVDPIQVTHKIVLDTQELYKHYQEICKEELPVNSPQEQINTCADVKLNDFIEKYTNLE
jgi:hypothetical protein